MIALKHHFSAIRASRENMLGLNGSIYNFRISFYLICSCRINTWHYTSLRSKPREARVAINRWSHVYTAQFKRE